MFDFMYDHQPAAEERVAVASTHASPQPSRIPVCIYNCGTEPDQLLKYGTLMSERQQNYICWSCMNQFNIMTANDRRRSGRDEEPVRQRATSQNKHRTGAYRHDR
jgi:hypothetical protein